LWLFWTAPFVGAVIAGFTYRVISPDQPVPVDVRGEA
jgi:hypothetical protein